MIHTIHTMTLNRLGLMFELEDPRMILRWGWLPEFMVKKAYIKFIEKFDQLFRGDVDQAFRKEILRTMLFNKVHNTLLPLYTGLLYKPTEYLEEVFEHYFGKKPETGQDLILILQEVDRLSKRFNLMFPKEDPEKEEAESEKISIDDLILGVETILDRTIDREMKVYQFQHYYEKSLKTLKARETRKHMKNG